MPDILRVGRHPCPAHQRPESRSRTLSVRHAPDGQWLLHCFRGCSTDAIRRAAGLRWPDLFPPATGPRPRRWKRTWQQRLEADIQQEARRQAAHLEPWVDVYQVADHIRTQRAAVAAMRRDASAFGDTADAWGILAAAADIERAVNGIEGELDACVRAL